MHGTVRNPDDPKKVQHLTSLPGAQGANTQTHTHTHTQTQTLTRAIALLQHQLISTRIQHQNTHMRTLTCTHSHAYTHAWATAIERLKLFKADLCKSGSFHEAMKGRHVFAFGFARTIPLGETGCFLSDPILILVRNPSRLQPFVPHRVAFLHGHGWREHVRRRLLRCSLSLPLMLVSGGFNGKWCGVVCAVCDGMYCGVVCGEVGCALVCGGTSCGVMCDVVCAVEWRGVVRCGVVGTV